MQLRSRCAQTTLLDASGRRRDPWEKNVPGLGLGRDPVRTPMPWSNATGAGFSTGEPWLPLGPDHRDVNVAVQATDPRFLVGPAVPNW
jgi:glycosidase